MKKSLLFLNLTLVFLVSSYLAGAQLLFEENFNYSAGEPLVKGAVASSVNSATTLTGWLTISNTASSATNSFNIAASGLTYTGYPSSGIGKALEYIDNGGQDVFKTFSSANTNPTPGAAYPGPKTVYVAFMIKVPAGDKDGAEYFFGIKYSNSASDNNYFGRIFAKVSGDNVKFGLSKSTAPTSTWSEDQPISKTHLLVLKYTMGGLNGANVTEETGKYDDKVDLFINPAIGTTEPSIATLHYENAADRDAYRYSSSNSLIGGLAAIYLRTPSTAGAIPASTIDGLRVADSWAKLFTTTTAISNSAGKKEIRIYTDISANDLCVEPGSGDYRQYEVYNISGVCVASKTIGGQHFRIDLDGLKKGIYILKLKGISPSYSAKFVVR